MAINDARNGEYLKMEYGVGSKVNIVDPRRKTKRGRPLSVQIVGLAGIFVNVETRDGVPLRISKKAILGEYVKKYTPRARRVRTAEAA